MGVSQYTAERVEKTRAKLAEARERLQSAQSQFIDAERKHADAMRAWEHEFFSDADERAKRLRERSQQQ